MIIKRNKKKSERKLDKDEQDHSRSRTFADYAGLACFFLVSLFLGNTFGPRVKGCV